MSSDTLGGGAVRRVIGRAASVAVAVITVTTSADAQPKEAAAALERALLGREVRILIDMPAASAGIDLYLQKEPEYDAKVLTESLSAYGVFAHRHAAEIEQELGIPVTFVQHLVPIDRGILETIYARLKPGVTA